MNRTELFDGLYRTRSELLRLIIASAHATIEPDKLAELVRRRDAITWTINALLDGELRASVEGLDAACTQIDAAAAALRHLGDVARDADKAIVYATKALDAATAVLVRIKS